MNTIVKAMIIFLIINSIIVSQERNEIENPYPNFIPYAVETDTIINNFNFMEIDNLGKEQPARWLSVDPLADRYPGWSPYNYTINNPLRYVDPNGKDIYIRGDQSEEAKSEVEAGTNFTVLTNPVTGQVALYLPGYRVNSNISQLEQTLINASIDNSINVNLLATANNTFNSIDGNQNVYNWAVGAFDGGTMDANGVINTSQIINLNQAAVWESAGGGSVSQSVQHEIIESYFGALQNKNNLNPGSSYFYNNNIFIAAHNATLNILPDVARISRVYNTLQDGNYLLNFRGPNGTFPSHIVPRPF